MTTAAFYARISLPGDTDRESGIDRQVRDCRDFIERQGWTLAGEFLDDGVSAYGEVERAAFERLLADMAQGKFDRVVAWRADRLARKPRDAVRLLDAAKKGHVVIRGATDGTDTSQPMGGFVFGLMVSIAEVESAGISTRVKSASDSLRKTGMKWGGPRAYGHSLDGTALVEEEAEVVREIARRILAGDTAMGIARNLDDRGIRSAKDGRWMPTKIISLLRSPRLCGRRWADETKQHLSKVGMAEILDEPTWRAVQAELDRRRARSKVGNRTPAHRLLTNIATCGRCGEPLKSKSLTPSKDRANGKKYPIYGCWPDYAKGQQPRGPGCGRLNIRADKTDDLATALMIRALEAPDLVARFAASRPKKQAASTSKKLQIERQKLIGLQARRLAGKEGEVVAEPEAQLLAESTLRERVARLTAQLAEEVAPAVLMPAFQSDAAAYWKRATLAQRRAIVRALTKRVVVLPMPEGAQARWRPDRLEIEWRV